MENMIYNFANEWGCKAYINNDGYREEIIIEDPNPEIINELDHQGLHYGIDGLEMVHIDIDEFKEYLIQEEY